MGEDFVEQVLMIVEAIPSGQVCSYGDIAEILDCGPRQIGAVMSRYGAAVCWWRVTNARGELPAHLLDDARQEWRSEGVAVSASGTGCCIDAHRADLVQILQGAHDTMES